MTGPRAIRVLSKADLAKLEVLPPGPVNLRRDLYRFVRYVGDKGLTRTRRENLIPKTAARDLAKVLSWEDEVRDVEDEGCGYWSDYVSRLALKLGLVSYDTKGTFMGYSSTEPSFPDNEVKIVDKAWAAYLKLSPSKKERTILDALLEMTGSEFFGMATLVQGEAFDSRGCAVGPASKMKLPAIRRRLLEILATLEGDVWHETHDVVDLLGATAPTLILDPGTREPDFASQQRLREWEWADKKRRGPKPDVTLDSLYTNFREIDDSKDRWSRAAERRIMESTPGAFHRVEGRYLEFFLREIPYVAGFVGLAYRKAGDRHGLDVTPPFEQLKAFCLTPRFFQVMRGAPDLDRVRVTVLPTFEVLVEAPSYPETVFEALEPHATLLQEDRHTLKFRLERKKIVQARAEDPKARPIAEILQALTGAALPGNVASELSSWSSVGDKVVFFEGLGLLEIRGSQAEASRVVSDLEGLVVDAGPSGFVVVRGPETVFKKLEERHHVPVRVRHEAESLRGAFGQAASPSGSETNAGRRESRKATREEALLVTEDLVGYRSSNGKLLAALHEAIHGQAPTCALLGNDRLVLSAEALPKLRGTLRKLSDRFQVTIKTSGGEGEDGP